jgi:HlyD family type I secretion membrane fusion protein
MIDKVLDDRSIHNFLFYIITTLFTFFIIWAYFSELDQVVRAEAKVEPVGKVQKIQSRYPGAIRVSNTQVGDIVTKGDTLFKLDTQEQQSLFDSATQQIALLNQERDIFTSLVASGIEPKIKLVQIESRILEVQQQLKKSSFQLQFSELRSPISGIITAVHIAGEGTVVGSGDIIAEVVPQEEFYLIKAKVLPKDISKVSIGQKCRVSFVTYDFSRYGVMEGIVTKIAHNTTETQEGEIYYDAWVKTQGSSFSNSDIDPNILPGMIATVDMLGEKRTILEYITSPLNRVAQKAFTE